MQTNKAGTQSFNPGTTTVAYIVTDASGNSSTCGFNVKINSFCNPTVALRQAPAAKGSEANVDRLQANLSPNPTSGAFRLTVQSQSRETINITVYSSDGRKVQQLKSSSLENITFGAAYQKGSYHIEVTQGDKRITVTGVKQ